MALGSSHKEGTGSVAGGSVAGGLEEGTCTFTIGVSPPQPASINPVASKARLNLPGFLSCTTCELLATSLPVVSCITMGMDIGESLFKCLFLVRCGTYDVGYLIKSFGNRMKSLIV